MEPVRVVLTIRTGKLAAKVLVCSGYLIVLNPLVDLFLD